MTFGMKENVWLLQILLHGLIIEDRVGFDIDDSSFSFIFWSKFHDHDHGAFLSCLFIGQGTPICKVRSHLEMIFPLHDCGLLDKLHCL